MYALWFCRLKQSWLVRGEFVGVMFIVTCVGRKLLSLYDVRVCERAYDLHESDCRIQRGIGDGVQK